MKELVTHLILGDLTSSEKITLWRLALTAVIAAHIAWTCGWVPGFTGFAQASQYIELKIEVEKIEARLLVKDLETAQERVCKGLAEENSEAVRYAAERRSRLIEQYQESKSSPPHLPTCDELGVPAPHRS